MRFFQFFIIGLICFFFLFLENHTVRNQTKIDQGPKKTNNHSINRLSSNFTSTKPKIIAFGDLRGYFEPCGCDPRTDLGGIVRLGGFIDLQRKNLITKHSQDLINLDVISLGNLISFKYSDNYSYQNRYKDNRHKRQNTPTPSKQTSLTLQDQFILKGLAKINPQAKLLGFSEYFALISKDLSNSHKQLIDSSSYILTQHKLAKKFITKRYAITKSLIIFGFFNYQRSIF